MRGSDGKLPLHWFTVPSHPIVSLAGVWRRCIRLLTAGPGSLVAPIYLEVMPELLTEEDEEQSLRAPFDGYPARPIPAEAHGVER